MYIQGCSSGGGYGGLSPLVKFAGALKAQPPFEIPVFGNLSLIFFLCSRFGNSF